MGTPSHSGRAVDGGDTARVDRLPQVTAGSAALRPLAADDPDLLLIVDAANVVGSRPDGWWRDRAGATARLRDALSPIAVAGLADLPPPVEVVLVVEGAARHVAGTTGVRMVRAARSGDDAIVDLVRTEAGGRRCVVVTADRALRDRVAALGAEVRGPRWLRPPPAETDTRAANPRTG